MVILTETVMNVTEWKGIKKSHSMLIKKKKMKLFIMTIPTKLHVQLARTDQPIALGIHAILLVLSCCS